MPRKAGTTRTLLAASIATIAATAPAGAQQQIRVAVTGGLATDQRGVQSRAVSLAPSAMFATATGTLLTLDGNVTRFDGGALSLGAGAGVVERAPIGGPFTITFDAAATASRLHAAGTSASFAAAEAAPALELGVRALALFAGGRAAVGHIAQSAARRLVLGFGGGSSTTVSATRSGVGPVFGGTFTSMPSPGEVFRVSAREERITVGGVRIADLTVSATLANSVSTFTGSIGSRRAPDELTSFGSAGVAINVTPTVTFNAAAGRYPSSRLTGALAGSFVSAGFAFSTSRMPESRAPGPRPRGVSRATMGYTRFTIDAPDATSVDLAGDFTDWTPVPAQRAANGVWYADLRLKPGQYRYAFRVNGKAWRVPHGATAVDDGFGGKSAWITVG